MPLVWAHSSLSPNWWSFPLAEPLLAVTKVFFLMQIQCCFSPPPPTPSTINLLKGNIYNSVPLLFPMIFLQPGKFLFTCDNYSINVLMALLVPGNIVLLYLLPQPEISLGPGLVSFGTIGILGLVNFCYGALCCALHDVCAALVLTQ